MNNKKTLIIIIAVVAIVVVATALFLAFKDIDTKNQLTKEINALSETNIDMEIKTQGNYGIIEKLVKEDCKIYFDESKKLRENNDKTSTLKVINIENYKNDGPEFKSSLDTLNTLKTENQNILNTLNELVSDKAIEERAVNAQLEGKYKSLYKEILQQIKIKEGVNNATETGKKIDAYLDSLLNVLNYMKDNKAEWFIENDTLKSKSQTFIDEYNAKVQETNVEL